MSSGGHLFFLEMVIIVQIMLATFLKVLLRITGWFVCVRECAHTTHTYKLFGTSVLFFFSA